MAMLDCHVSTGAENRKTEERHFFTSPFFSKRLYFMIRSFLILKMAPNRTHWSFKEGKCSAFGEKQFSKHVVTQNQMFQKDCSFYCTCQGQWRPESVISLALHNDRQLANKMLSRRLRPMMLGYVYSASDSDSQREDSLICQIFPLTTTLKSFPVQPRWPPLKSKCYVWLWLCGGTASNVLRPLQSHDHRSSENKLYSQNMTLCFHLASTCIKQTSKLSDWKTQKYPTRGLSSARHHIRFMRITIIILISDCFTIKTLFPKGFFWRYREILKRC